MPYTTEIGGEMYRRVGLKLGLEHLAGPVTRPNVVRYKGEIVFSGLQSACWIFVQNARQECGYIVTTFYLNGVFHYYLIDADNGGVCDHHETALVGPEHLSRQNSEAPTMQRNERQRYALALPLWQVLGDIPIDDDEAIELSFLHFPAGTPRVTIWHWFEDAFDIALFRLLYLRSVGGDAIAASEKIVMSEA